MWKVILSALVAVSAAIPQSTYGEDPSKLYQQQPIEAFKSVQEKYQQSHDNQEQSYSKQEQLTYGGNQQQYGGQPQLTSYEGSQQQSHAGDQQSSYGGNYQLQYEGNAQQTYGGGHRQTPQIKEEFLERPRPYTFDFDVKTDDSASFYQKEDGDENGFKKGTYGYRDAAGLYRLVEYIADNNGFRATIKTNEPGTHSAAPADVEIVAEESPIKYEAPTNSYKSHAQSYGSSQAQSYGSAQAQSYGNSQAQNYGNTQAYASQPQGQRYDAAPQGQSYNNVQNYQSTQRVNYDSSQSHSEKTHEYSSAQSYQGRPSY